MGNPHDLADRWSRVLRERQASGLSVAAFCRRAGKPYSSPYAWRRRLRSTGDFVDVQLPTGTTAASSAIELWLAGDRHIIVRPGFDGRTLVELLDTLETWSAGLEDAEAGA